jgi:uncharacterized protein
MSIVMNLKKPLALLLYILLFSVYSPCQTDRSLTDNPPKLTEYVTDESGTLKSEEISSLRSKLRKFHDSTSTQVVVLLVNTLNGEPVENVSNSIFRFNGIGGKGKDNGVLLLISKSERKIRLEVGYGLEGTLTDAMSKQIIQKEITPDLKNGNYFKGIDNAVTAVISLTKGEYSIEKSGSKSGATVLQIILAVLIPVIIIIVLIVIIIKIKRKTLGGSGIAGSTGFFIPGSSDSYSSSGSDSSSSSDDNGFSGGGGDSGGGGASGDY